MEEAIDELEETVEWPTNRQGQLISMIRFVDDIVIIAENKRKHQDIRVIIYTSRSIDIEIEHAI